MHCHFSTFYLETLDDQTAKNALPHKKEPSANMSSLKGG